MLAARRACANQLSSGVGNHRAPWEAPNAREAFAVVAGGGELLEIGPVRMRILEDGSQRDNRIGAAISVMPAGSEGPPLHRHLMFDETFLVMNGVMRFSLGSTQKDAKTGDYMIVPAGAWHTFTNASDATVEFYSTFTPAYYINYFRELARLSAESRLTPQENIAVMKRYATEPYSA